MIGFYDSSNNIIEPSQVVGTYPDNNWAKITGTVSADSILENAVKAKLLLGVNNPGKASTGYSVKLGGKELMQVFFLAAYY
jgi:hypothetical protein